MTKLTSLLNPFISTTHTLHMRRIHSLSNMATRRNHRNTITLFLNRSTRLLLRLSNRATRTSRITLHIMRNCPMFLNNLPLFFNLINRNRRRKTRLNTNFNSSSTLIHRYNRYTSNNISTRTRLINNKTRIIRHLTRVTCITRNFSNSYNRRINSVHNINTNRVRLHRNQTRMFNNLTSFRTIKHYRIRYTTRATKRGVKNQRTNFTRFISNINKFNNQMCNINTNISNNLARLNRLINKNANINLRNTRQYIRIHHRLSYNRTRHNNNRANYNRANNSRLNLASNNFRNNHDLLTFTTSFNRTNHRIQDIHRRTSYSITIRSTDRDNLLEFVLI